MPHIYIPLQQYLFVIRYNIYIYIYIYIQTIMLCICTSYSILYDVHWHEKTKSGTDKEIVFCCRENENQQHGHCSREISLEMEEDIVSQPFMDHWVPLSQIFT